MPRRSLAKREGSASGSGRRPARRVVVRGAGDRADFGRSPDRPDDAKSAE